MVFADLSNCGNACYVISSELRVDDRHVECFSERCCSYHNAPACPVQSTAAGAKAACEAFAQKCARLTDYQPAATVVVVVDDQDGVNRIDVTRTVPKRMFSVGPGTEVEQRVYSSSKVLVADLERHELIQGLHFLGIYDTKSTSVHKLQSSELNVLRQELCAALSNCASCAQHISARKMPAAELKAWLHARGVRTSGVNLDEQRRLHLKYLDPNLPIDERDLYLPRGKGKKRSLEPAEAEAAAKSLAATVWSVRLSPYCKYDDDMPDVVHSIHDSLEAANDAAEAYWTKEAWGVDGLTRISDDKPGVPYCANACVEYGGGVMTVAVEKKPVSELKLAMLKRVLKRKGASTEGGLHVLRQRLQELSGAS